MWSALSIETSGSEYRTENIQFGTAKTLARRGCGADRAVVLHQQEAPGIRLPLRHVALARTKFRQQRNALGEGVGRRQSLAIGPLGLRPAHLDETVQRRIAQLGSDRLDQLQRQFRMRIRKAAMAGGGEVPNLRRPANAAPLGLRRDKSLGGKPDKMLACRLGGDPQHHGQIGDALRPAPLDCPEQPIGRRRRRIYPSSYLDNDAELSALPQVGRPHQLARRICP